MKLILLSLIGRIIGVIIPLQITSCNKNHGSIQSSRHHNSVYEAIINDLAAKDPPNPKFVGERVLVVNEFRDGDSFFFGMSDEALVDAELKTALKIASASSNTFPPTKDFGAMASITSERPMYYLNYYNDDETRQVEGRIFVEFWPPGFSNDGKRAIVRAWVGPFMHETIITYLLYKSKDGWKIQSSSTDKYP